MISRLLWATPLLIVALLIFVPASHVSALADPDTIHIRNAFRYDSVAVAGDMFVMVQYELLYDPTPLPDESIGQGWLGRLIDIGGAGQLGSVQPYSGSAIPDLGYSTGVFGFYFAEAPTLTGTLRVTLEGNPTISPTPTGIYLEPVNVRDASLVASDLRVIALELEEIWDVDLISPLFGGVNRFTTDGEHYFSSALPNLRNVAPDMFVLQSTTVGVPDREFDTSYTDERFALYDLSPIGTGFENLATALGVSNVVGRFIVAMVIVAVMAWYVSNSVGMNIAWTSTLQIWAGYLVLMMGFWIGIVSAPVLGIITVLGFLATITIIFLQKTST
jgi:hypothetical protein